MTRRIIAALACLATLSCNTQTPKAEILECPKVKCGECPACPEATCPDPVILEVEHGYDGKPFTLCDEQKAATLLGHCAKYASDKCKGPWYNAGNYGGWTLAFRCGSRL